MDNQLQIFDINCADPVFKCNLSPTKRSKDGLKGILSCIAFNPDYSGIYSVGSFSGGIGLFDERNHDCFVILDSLVEKKRKGVSAIQFSPCGHYLFSRYRESTVPAIECWDIRNSQKVLYKLALPPRPIGTVVKQFTRKSNQRLGFAIDRGLLAAGFHDGRVGIWNLYQSNELESNSINNNLKHVKEPWTPELVCILDPWETKEYSLACHSVNFTPDQSPSLMTLGPHDVLEELNDLMSGVSLVCHFQERVFPASLSDEDEEDEDVDVTFMKADKKKRIMDRYSRGLTVVYRSKSKESETR